MKPGLSWWIFAQIETFIEYIITASVPRYLDSGAHF